MMNSVNSRDSKVKLSIFFDGSCQLCNAEINYYRSRDKTQCFEFLDVSCKRTELPRILTRQRALERFHVLKNDQTLLSGSGSLMWLLFLEYLQSWICCTGSSSNIENFLFGYSPNITFGEHTLKNTKDSSL